MTMKKSIIAIALLIAIMACWAIDSPVQQAPVFSQNQQVVIKWLPPADDDVVKYTAYFVPEGSGNIVNLQIVQWNAVEDTLSVFYNVPMPTGNWRLYLTATDEAGNESEPSDSFLFSIKDAAPGKPLQVIMIPRKG